MARRAHDWIIQLGPQREKFGINSIELLKIRVQARGVIANVAEAEDEIGSELMLNFKAPVLYHTRAAVARPCIAGIALKISIEQSRILGIGRRRESRKTSIQRSFPLHEHRRKAICGGKCRIDCGPAAKRIAKVGVEEGGMIDTVPTADHHLAEPAEQFLRSIGKSDARAEVLIVGLRTCRVGAVDQSA